MKLSSHIDTIYIWFKRGICRQYLYTRVGHCHEIKFRGCVVRMVDLGTSLGYGQ